MSEYRKAKRHIDVSPGESVKIIRELQEMSQNDLAAASGIPQSTISAIERERIKATNKLYITSPHSQIPNVDI